MSKTTAGPTAFVDVTTASTPVLPQNLGRRELTVVNDGANVIYLAFGKAATANNGCRLNAAGGSYTTNNWQGAVNAIALTATTRLCVMEN